METMVFGEIARRHWVVLVAGFKPIGAEKHSGSIPPSGRNLFPLLGQAMNQVLIIHFGGHWLL